MKSINESTIKYVKGKNESYNLYWAVGGLAHAWVIMYNMWLYRFIPVTNSSNYGLDKLVWSRSINCS